VKRRTFGPPRAIERPEQGGTIEMLLKGNKGHGMLDNVTIDRRGGILIDEDPGNSDRVSKIWLYQIGTGEFPSASGSALTRDSDVRPPRPIRQSSRQADLRGPRGVCSEP
jgi:hypothetical protein